MNREKKNVIIIIIISVIGIGVYLFYNWNSFALVSFLQYSASLSTVVMVVIVLFTFSSQFDAMNNQLIEMQYTRNVQSQPLFNFNNLKCQLFTPHFYFNPADRKEIRMYNNLVFAAKIENIGNSPAIAIDIFPDFFSVKDQPLKAQGLGESFECISNEEKDSRKVLISVNDLYSELITSLLNRVIFLELNVVYKNILGMTFLQKARYVMGPRSEKQGENVKLFNKSILSHQIDYSGDINSYHFQYEQKDYEKAGDILEKLNEKVDSVFEDAFIDFNLELMSGSFKVSPLQESEYQKIVK